MDSCANLGEREVTEKRLLGCNTERGRDRQTNSQADRRIDKQTDVCIDANVRAIPTQIDERRERG